MKENEKLNGNEKLRRRAIVRHPGSLFRRRVAAHWRQIGATLRSAADWTVMLYILIPGMLLAAGMYRELWTAPLPGWLQLLPYPMAVSVLLIVFSGRLLLFVEEADVLFLRQNLGWMRGLKGRGMAYSFTVITLKGLLLMLIAMPVMIRGFGLNGVQLAGFSLLAAGTGWLASLVAHRIRIRWKGFKAGLLAVLVRTASLALYLMVVDAMYLFPWAAGMTGVVLLVLTVMLAVRLSREMTAFSREVREDLRIRSRLADLMITYAAGRPPKVREKSILFRKSRRLLPSNSPAARFAGAGVKAFLRRPESLLLYVQFLGVGIPAVLFPPGIIKAGVYAALMLLLGHMLQQRWRAFAGAEAAVLLPFTEYQEMKAGSLAVSILMVLPALMLSLLFGMTLWADWKGPVIGLVLAALSAYVVPGIFSRPSLKRGV